MQNLETRILSDGESKCVTIAGLSTETKPEGFATGSLFWEVDTGDIYAYCADNDTWYKNMSLGGDA